MKGRNDGIENEKQIVSAINEKKIGILSEYQKKFLHQLASSAKDDTVVYAKKIGGMGYKPDVEIQMGNNKWNVSVKKGGGNSVHQEKTDYFIHYCMKYLGMTEKEKESLLLFLYGDGTIDGNSSPEERLRENELVETYKEQIAIVQKFLEKNKRNLLERFLIYGRMGREHNIKADYLYHGDALEGVWCPLDGETIDYLARLDNASNAPLSIGPLTIQVWNRNLEGKASLEDRRHSIQVKWSSCKAYIEQINEIHLRNKLKNVDSTRVLGDNSQGFENQEKLIALLDGARISELSLPLKNIIKELYPSVANTEKISAKKISGSDIKPKIAISVNGENRNLSVFMGSGNAVHQENLDTFIPYCKETLGMTDEEEVALLYLIYGDGTIDGKSKAEDRLGDTNQIKEKYSKEVQIVQSFINRNKKDLAERFLVYGKGGKEKNIKADYIYYGTDVTGRLTPYDAVIEHIINQDNSKKALLAIGSLTIQTWNRNLSANPAYEYKRNSLQVKWGQMKENLRMIREEIDTNKKGTVDGDWEEYELVSKLNRDKKALGRLWSVLVNKLDISELDDIYAIRVSHTVYSKLSGRMVLPKADVYLVKGKIGHQVLLDNNYWLDEDTIEGLDVNIIENSGISCKRPDSSSYTYAKLSINSFCSLFNDSKLGAGISLFVKESELALNKDVVKAWDTTEKELLEKFKVELINASIDYEKSSLENIETCKAIKTASIAETKRIIKQNKQISDAIFFGKGVFEEPYTANFVYINGVLSETYVPEFSVTTGSGRHKGNYTIVIKP